MLPPDPRGLPAPEGERLRRLWRVNERLQRAGLLGETARAEALREFTLLGAEALPALRQAARGGETPAARLARDAVHVLVPEELGAQLELGLNGLRERFPAELGAAVLARLGDAELDPQALLKRLDQLAARAGEHIRAKLKRPASEPRAEGKTVDTVFRLGEFWRAQGFEGDRESYYSPRNSMLGEVLERKRGIPISLSVVYLALCRRLGLQAAGIGMPAHFIVRVDVREAGKSGCVFVDPYHAARPLDLDDCRELVERHGQRFVPEQHLRPIAPRDLLARMCYNLLNVYDRQRKPLEAERVLTVLLHLAGRHPSLLMARATRRADRGANGLAAGDLQEALRAEPNLPGAQELLRRLEYREAT